MKNSRKNSAIAAGILIATIFSQVDGAVYQQPSQNTYSQKVPQSTYQPQQPQGTYYQPQQPQATYYQPPQGSYYQQPSQGYYPTATPAPGYGYYGGAPAIYPYYYNTNPFPNQTESNDIFRSNQQRRN